VSPAADRDQTLEQLEDVRTRARALQDHLETLVGKMGALWQAEDDRVLVLAHQRDEARAEVDRTVARNVEMHNVNAAARDVIDRLQRTCNEQAREVRRLRALLTAAPRIRSGAVEIVQPDPAGDLTEAELLRARGARAGKWFARLVAEVVRRRAEERMEGFEQIGQRAAELQGLLDAAHSALEAERAELDSYKRWLQAEKRQGETLAAAARAASDRVAVRNGELEQAQHSIGNALFAGAELALSHLTTESGDLDMAELEPMGYDLYALHPRECGGLCEWSCGAFIMKLGPPDPDEDGRRAVLEVHYGTLKAVRS